MKVKMLLFCAVYVFCICTANAQSFCEKGWTFKTDSVGDGINSIPYNMVFMLIGDTLRIGRNENVATAVDNVPFVVLSKSCKWTGNSGEIILRLSINRDGNFELPELVIRAIDGIGKIQLLYPNKEPRVFNLIQ